MQTRIKDLVLLRLNGEQAKGVRRFQAGQWTELTVESESAIREFRRLIDQFPDSLIAWCDEFLEPYLAPPEKWPGLLNHNLEILHAGGLQQCQASADSIGLVDWHSPFILPPPKQVRYPTWMASPWAGIGHASLFRHVGFDPAIPTFTSALWDSVARAMKCGACPYSEPRLIASEPPAALVQAHKSPLSNREIVLLVRRIYGAKWVLFWLAGSILSCRSVPLLSALKALLAPGVAVLDERALGELGPKLDDAVPSNPAIDVIIPTLGRPDFLIQTLEDLALQELLPAKVIVVEQQPGGPSPLLGEKLATRKWPFQVIHRCVSWTGACKARNLALREVAGEWVLMLDDDVRLTRGFLRYLVSVAHAYCVEVVNGATYLAGDPGKRSTSPQGVLCWGGFSSGCSLVSKTMIDAARGFDERGEGGFGEDTEYGIRLRLCGGNILYAPGEPVLHLKAPIGGFRYTFPHPWLKEKVQPKPSPTIQYYTRKHTSRSMQFGYAQFYFLKRLASCSWYRVPFEFARMITQWRSSVRWADKLAEGPEKAKHLHRLVLISHVTHYEWEKRLFAYGPYAREIDLWADLFPEVVIAAPLRREQPPGDAIAFTRQNISITPQLETGGDGFISKAIQIMALPIHAWRLARAMRRADAIHVRCPGNLGLLGCLLAPCFRTPRVAKYAGQWNDYEGETRTWRWQKMLLRSRWWNAPVLVYGQWPGQPDHVVPFFTSVTDEGQMARARSAAPRDWRRRPLDILFVGRLSPAKNVDVLLQAMARSKGEGESLRLRIVGDGPQRAELEALAGALGIADRVFFEGAVPQSRVLDFYELAHVLVLASQTEGWPKAIAEGMAFGLVCIGSNCGFVPQMLADGRGLLVEPGDAGALAGTLRQVVRDVTEAAQISGRAAVWARRFTLEGLGEALRDLLEERWGVALNSNSLSR